MKVVWTQRATARLRGIGDHIRRETGHARGADKVVRTLVRKSKRLGWPGMSRSGRQVPEYQNPDVLELVVAPYRVIYTVLPARIDVLTVMHERQLLPGDADQLG